MEIKLPEASEGLTMSKDFKLRPYATWRHRPVARMSNALTISTSTKNKLYPKDMFIVPLEVNM